MNTSFFKKLEENKKKYSMLFLTFSSLVLGLIIVLVHSDLIKVMVACVLLIHVVISIIYLVKGIAFGAMCLVYYLFFVIGILLALTLQFIVPLPSFISKEILNSLSVMLFVIFTTVIPLPQYVKEYFQDKLNDITLKKTKAADLFFEKEEEKRVTYDTLMEYKTGINYAAKPYSLALCPPVLRTLRIIAGFAFIGIGMIALLIGLNSEDNAISYINSWVFWTIIAALILLILGFTILLLGFMRALLSLLLCMLLSAAGYYVYHLLRLVFAKSLLLFFITIVLVFACVAMIGYLLIKSLTIKNQHSLTYYENNDGFRGVDLALYNALPIVEYDTAIKIQIEANSDISVKQVESFNNQLIYFASRRRLIVAGVVFSYSTYRYEVIIYSKHEEKSIKLLKSFLKENISYPYEIQKVKDGGWNIYKEYLYPDEYTLIESYNKNLIIELEDEEERAE